MVESLACSGGGRLLGCTLEGFVRLAAIVVLAFSLVSAARSQSLDPVDNYLSSAEQKANNVVYNAGAQGRGIAMEAGQAALNAIGSFRAAYADSLKLTESALKGQQAQLFQNIKSSMDLLDQWSSGATVNLQGVTDSLSNAVLNLPFASDIPRVSRISPLYSVEGLGPAQELVVHGIGLSNGSPTLEVGGRVIGPNTKTDAEIRFPMPIHGNVVGQPLLFPATLHLFERTTKYLVFHDYIPMSYPVRLAIYPKEIGQFTITPRRKVATSERNPVTTLEYRCESPHGEGDSNVPVNIAPTPGWTIDVNTIRYNKAYENNGSFTMGTTAATGFTANLKCSGFGKSPFNAGNQGVEKGTFSYVEVREGTTLQNGDTKKLTLRWGDSLTVADLPTDTETVLFELLPFTGQTLDLEGAGGNRFVRLDFNAASKVATVTARGVEEALRQ
jgi:hypothetical protein